MYTVQELMRMREAIFDILTPPGVSYYQDEVNRQVESQLVTYMANETSPEELEEYARELRAKRRDS